METVIKGGTETDEYVKNTLHEILKVLIKVLQKESKFVTE